MFVISIFNLFFNKLIYYFNEFTAATRSACSIKQQEPNGPSVVTSVPGPKSKALLEELNTLQVSVITLF